MTALFWERSQFASYTLQASFSVNHHQSFCCQKTENWVAEASVIASRVLGIKTEFRRQLTQKNLYGFYGRNRKGCIGIGAVMDCIFSQQVGLRWISIEQIQASEIANWRQPQSAVLVSSQISLLYRISLGDDGCVAEPVHD